MLDSWWWTEKLSETWRVLFQKYIWEISASRWFYYKNKNPRARSPGRLNFVRWHAMFVSTRYLLHVTLLAPWIVRWLLYIWEIWETLIICVFWNVQLYHRLEKHPTSVFRIDDSDMSLWNVEDFYRTTILSLKQNMLLIPLTLRNKERRLKGSILVF
jgi:hypothetical protein